MDHHARAFTVTLPHPTLKGLIRRARRFERRFEAHWPFCIYALLTFSTAGYVIVQLVTIP